MFFAIVANGVTSVIDAPSKSAANAFAHQTVQIEVRPATKADLAGLNFDEIPNVVKGGKTDAQVAEEKAAAEKKAADKAAKEAAKATATV